MGPMAEIPELTPERLSERLAEDAPPALIDVREPWETAICHIPGSLFIPMAQIPGALAQLQSVSEAVIVCHHGVRSAQVAAWLETQGVRALSLAEGVEGWAARVDPDMARY